MEYLNFGWVIHGSLAGAQGPTSNRDLMFLKLQTIGAIVRMEEQTISGAGLELVDMYEPVTDFTPPNPEQIDKMVSFISEQIETWERPVVVTCYAGLGRTGTVLACYLVSTGYSAEQAVRLVRELRPNSIQTREQEEAVLQYQVRFKERETERRRKAREALEDSHLEDSQ